MTDGGTIIVKAENIELTSAMNIPLPEDRYVCISIKDQGLGIPDHNLDKIFDPYFTTRDDGNGLGLTTAFAIVQRHSGHITVESDLGIGTTIAIYLPASDGEADEEQQESIVHQGQGKILVMDDEETIRISTKAALKHLGYQVDTASDGAEAIEKYKAALEASEPFDAAIMDLTVPGGLGAKETASEILSVHSTACLIVLSGYSHDPVVTEYEKFGFAAAVSKPYNIEELSTVLSTTLKSRKSSLPISSEAPKS